MKTYLITAVSAAALTFAGIAGVTAQQAPAPSSTMPSATTDTTVMPKSTTGVGSGGFAATQSASDWRASTIVGMNVYNPKNEKIGDINDLIIGSSGDVAYAVIGVGGFLGLGEKNVAIPFGSVKMARDKDGKQTAVIDSTKETLSAAPAFKFYTLSNS